MAFLKLAPVISIYLFESCFKYHESLILRGILLLDLSFTLSGFVCHVVPNNRSHANEFFVPNCHAFWQIYNANIFYLVQ